MEYPQTPQDLKIVHFEAGDFKDDHNNTWCNVLFEGYTGEQIRWVVKDPSKYSVGMTVYGHFEQKMSKANKPYIRFYTDQRQQYGGSSAPAQAGQVAQAKYAPKDDHTQESIARSVALKAAVDFVAPIPVSSRSPEAALGVADLFLAWLQGGSTGSAAVSTPSAPVTTQATENPQSAATSSGYDKFKQQGSRLADKREDEAIHETLIEQAGFEDLPPDW